MIMHMKFMIVMGICSVSTLTAIGKSQEAEMHAMDETVINSAPRNLEGAK